MYMASLFGNSRPYSTKEMAERELAKYIAKNNMRNIEANHSGPFTDDEEKLKIRFVTAFNDAMRREHYAQAIACWNDYARQFLYHNTQFIGTVTEIAIDKPFQEA